MAASNSLWADKEDPTTLVLFDVDGPLTAARKPASQEILDALARLRRKVVIGFVGGSDLSKQEEQLGTAECGAVARFDYAFSENGLTAFRGGEQLAAQSFIGWLGEDKYQRLVDHVLRRIADTPLPFKRGTFVEFRRGMINISPVGRNCTPAERDAFETYDREHGVRKAMVAELREKFADLGLTFSIGGQISFDVFPAGWDKTYCLRHVQGDKFKTIHFFGDKTMLGGNDYEIFSHPDVTGHTVLSPADTLRELKQLFGV